MNKYKFHMLWLSLPAVLVVLYFAAFPPSPDSMSAGHAPSDGTAENSGASSSAQVTAAAKPAVVPAAVVDAGLPHSPMSFSGNESLEDVARDREFINYAFPLLSTWDLEEIKPLLANKTKDASTDEELNEVMSVLDDRLGDLKYFETPQPVATHAEADGASPAKLQHYQSVAYYEAGEAAVDLILHKGLNVSSLYSFNIQVAN